MKKFYFDSISLKNSLVRKGITKKLFIITSIFLIIFVVLTMYMQSIFFEEFYVKAKTKKFRNNIEKFNTLYSENYISLTNIRLIIRQFEENNNANILIIGSNGVIKYWGDINLNTNDSDNTSKLNTIYQVFSEWTSSPNKLQNIIKNKKTITTIYYNQDFEISNIVCISPSHANSNSDIILAVSSLQPIEEASEIIKEFFVYVFIGALTIIILLSLIYSNMISKPLIKLNNAARKMSEMDFTVHCDVKSDDELGNLAGTLNFLSQKLDKALTELKLRNEELEKDIENERRIDRMRKEFVAGVSHELKTPIALISGYAEGLEDNIADEDSRNFYIDVIRDEADKMSNLVSDMLDLSQLESGNFKLKPENFYIDKLLKRCLSKHQQSMLQKNVFLVNNIGDNILVYGDITRIEQVITNFITNAIRHVLDNGEICIRTINEVNKVKIEIENSGENIPKDELENIWDKFYKLDKSRTRITGGTGLGLSIVKNILLLHNSTFGVRNTHNGVVFYFTLNKVEEIDD